MGFLMHRDVVEAIISCTPVDLHISARLHNVTIVQVYASTYMNKASEVDEIY